MTKYAYPAIFHLAEEGGFWVSFPDFPECFTDGDDIASVYEMATEALGLAITSRKEEGQEIPTASSVTNLTADDGTITIIEFDMLEYQKKHNSRSVMKSVEYYLSKGFDRPMAEYFASGRKKIVSVTPNDNFTLILKFDNDETRLFDCNNLLKIGTVFEPFMQLSNFKRVYLDDTGCVAWDIDPNVDSNKVWNNKVDLSSDSCYVDSVPVSLSTTRS